LSTASWRIAWLLLLFLAAIPAAARALQHALAFATRAIDLQTVSQRALQAGLAPGTCAAAVCGAASTNPKTAMDVKSRMSMFASPKA
jgi:hypothetical protein